MALPRLAVLAAPDASMSPVEIVSAAKGVADVVLLLDRAQVEQQPQLLSVARALATTEVLDLADVAEGVRAIRRHHAHHVATYADRYCQVVDAIRSHDGSDPHAGRWRKNVQRRLLLDNGLSTATQLPLEVGTGVGDLLGYPLVVKPVSGVASRDVTLVQSDVDLRAVLAELTQAGMKLADFVVERYVGGSPPNDAPYLADYVSVELFVGSTSTAAFVTDRPPLAWPCRETGIAGPTAVGPLAERSLIEYAKCAHSALGLGSGCFHIEMKLATDRPEVIEVNGRLGGYVRRLVRYGTGVDIGPASIRCAVGRNPELDLVWTRHVFGLLYQAPSLARQVAAVPERRDLAQLDGVIAVDHVSDAGARLDWRQGSGAAVAKYWLAADTRDQAWHRVVAATDWLDRGFTFVDSSGEIVPGREPAHRPDGAS